VVDWYFFGGVAGMLLVLFGRHVYRRSHQEAAAKASGLTAVADLTHVSDALQRTALWNLAEGGFERRVVHGSLARGEDVDVTAFDLETLRERRGEWAYLPIDQPFRIGGIVSVVVCEIDRKFPHVLFKRAGSGDELIDDNRIERLGHIAKTARDRLGLARSYASEMPVAIPEHAIDVALPAGWRVYTQARELVDELIAGGFRATLERADRRDLVIELLDNVVVVYPAARDVVGADAFADLTTTALIVVDGVLASSRPLTPRGVEKLHSSDREVAD
jgi:hypothetical protein